VTESLEATVEAVVLLSGLAFENGGLSLAHSLTRGLMRDAGARAQPHGHHVAWGALVQSAAEHRPDREVLSLMAFLRSTGLPVCAADLGIATPVEPALREIARWTMTAPHLLNLVVPVDEEAITQAALRVESLAAVG
jgi:glycerol dehydrogenase